MYILTGANLELIYKMTRYFTDNYNVYYSEKISIKTLYNKLADEKLGYFLNVLAGAVGIIAGVVIMF